MGAKATSRQGPNVPAEMYGLSSVPTLSSILTIARSKASSEPRDKIFALLGILNELGFDCILPEYGKAVEDVYREATIMAIKNDNDIFVLSQVPSNQRRPGLPSWVPDWSDPGFTAYSGFSKPHLISDLNRGVFCAGPAEPIWDFNASHRHLKLKGKLIDSVIYRGSTLETSQLIPSRMEIAQSNYENIKAGDFSEIVAGIYSSFKVTKNWVDMTTWMPEYPSGESVKSALRRTLFYDSSDPVKEKIKAESFEAWYLAMTATDHDLTTMAMEGSGIPNASSDGSEELCKAFEAVHPEEIRVFLAMDNNGRFDFHAQAAVSSNQKCLFITGNGYMGTGTDRVKPGDRIALVAGFNMPLLLRPADGGYELITHVYVHGVMYGEAWPPNNEELEEITLV